MEKYDNLVFADFDEHNKVTVASPRSVVVTTIPGYDTLVSITGGPFLIASSFNGYVAAVANSDTPPHTPLFVLVYQASSGLFQKSMVFDNNVLKMVTTDIHIVVSTESKITIIDSITYNEQHVIKRSCSSGLIAATQSLLAWTDDTKPGTVRIESLVDYVPKEPIVCHNSWVRAMAFSQDSTKLVTASHKGTMIRVFNTNDGKKLAEFRRGFTNSDVIALAVTDNVVCACSKSTIHTFNFEGKHFTINAESPPLACKFVEGGLLVVSTNGCLSQYTIDLATAIATLVNQHNLLNSDSAFKAANRRGSL